MFRRQNMAIFVVVTLFLLGVTTAELYNPLSDEFIESINAQQTSWTAGRNFPHDTTIEHIKKLMGTFIDKEYYPKLPQKTFDPAEFSDLPEHFDPREQWPNCSSLWEIRDQGCCGSCWVFGAVSAMTDRLCIQNKANKPFHFSAEDLLTCSQCGDCDGGYPSCAWQYWYEKGIVSGGNFDSDEGCRPYQIPNDPKQNPCLHFMPTPTCEQTCRKGENAQYQKDKHFGQQPYTISGVEDFKKELYSSGPIEVVIGVYEDFLSYKSGVYEHVKGKLLGGHAIKLMGWGVENGKDYWLLANSWNTTWGDGGYFKFLRGSNHCGIEEYGNGALPKQQN